jgi:hypothetical protein
MVKKGENGANIVYTYCIYIYVNGKIIAVKTIPGKGERGMKENGRGGEFKYNIFCIL